MAEHRDAPDLRAGAPPPERGSPRSAVLEVGQVVRPHGLGGRVVVELWTNRLERIAAGSELRTGGRVLEVVSASSMGGAGLHPRYLVAFAGVAARDEAESLRGAVLSAEPLEVDGAMWIDQLVGTEVYDADGSLAGRVEAVQANPASDLLVLGDGRLLPLRFVHWSGDRLVVDGPPGLLDRD